jgi:hypothetical protein
VSRIEDRILSWRTSPPFDGEPDYVSPAEDVITAALVASAVFHDASDVAADGEGGIEFFWRQPANLTIVRCCPNGDMVRRVAPLSPDDIAALDNATPDLTPGDAAGLGMGVF